MLHPDIEAGLRTFGIAVRRPPPTKIGTLGKLDQVYHRDRLTMAFGEGFLRAAAGDATIAAVLVSEQLGALAESLDPRWGILTCAGDPRPAFWGLHNHLCEETDFYGSRQLPAPVIGSGSRVAATAVLEPGVRIGIDCVIEDYAILKRGTVLGDHVTIGCHSVLGRDGFEAFELDGIRRHVRHAGSVRIGDHVVMHGSCHVDRALWGATTIGVGTHLDNLCHIAHGCSLGRNNFIAAGTVFAGLVVVGDANFFGVGATVKHMVTIGSGCRIPMAAVVARNVSDGTELVTPPSLTPAEFAAYTRMLVRMRRPGGASGGE